MEWIVIILFFVLTLCIAWFANQIYISDKEQSEKWLADVEDFVRKYIKEKERR